MSAYPARINTSSVPSSRPHPESGWTEEVSRALEAAAARGDIHAWTDEEIEELLSEDEKTIGMDDTLSYDEFMESIRAMTDGSRRMVNGWTQEEIESILDELDEEEIDEDSLISHEEFMRIMRAKIHGIQN